MKSKCCLITGATGFLGSILVDELKIQQYSVKSVVRSLNKSAFPNTDLIVVGSINRTTDWRVILDDVDVIVHTAARVHIMSDSSSDPLADYKEINMFATINLAKQAVESGVKRFIYISTAKANGESTKLGVPFRFDDDFVPIDPYGLSKYEAEAELRKIAKETGMEVVIIRPPLVYGEGVKANFASMMSWVGKGVPFPFRAINTNKRSLVSVYNLVDLIKVCIDHPKAANQTFLVSDDDDLSTARMVALMAKVQGKMNLALPVPIFCFKIAGKLLGKSDVVDRLVGSLQLDIEHTKNILGWVPPYTVEHGFELAAKKKG